MKRLAILLLICWQFALDVKGFPENLNPRNAHYDAPTQVFTGESDGTDSQSLFVQDMKVLRLNSVSRIAVMSRENLYLLDPYSLKVTNNSINFKENYDWISDEKTHELCLKKGQLPELCRNYLSVLELSKKNEMLLCGTNAFDPKCRKCSISIADNSLSFEQKGPDMNGRQRSPFGPNQPSTSFFTGGSLYSATYQSLFGGMAVLTRTMGPSSGLHTASNTAIMNKPEFIKMIDDGTRLLIFFNEIETLPAGETRTIPQVAQVCKTDEGGKRILQGLFTSFIKSRLNCSYNGFYFNRLTDLTEPINVNNEMTVFATFATPENSLAGSVVCSFTLSSIQTTLAGPFLLKDEEWKSNVKGVPTSTSHPGLCSTEPLSEPEMLFVKSHPQLQNQVPGTLLLTNQGQRWTSVRVENIKGQKENVVFIGTHEGHLIRAFSFSPNLKKSLIISDQNVFDKERCESKEPQNDDKRILRIAVENDIIFVAFKHCVVTLPLQWCSDYGCESACRQSGDPFCGWNGTYCVPISRPVSIDERLLKSKASALCADTILEHGDPVDERKNLEKIDSEKTKSTSANNPRLPVTPAEIEASQENLYTMHVLVLVALGTLFITLILVFIVYLTVRCYRRKKNEKEPADFKKKQTEEIHQMSQNDDKRSSLSRRFQDFIVKATTPSHSPQINSKKAARRQRQQNVYTAPPSLKPRPESADVRSLRTSHRMNSVSSGSSRQDSSFCPTEPLLQTNQEMRSTDETLPRYIADAPTIRHVHKATSDVLTTTSSSPNRSSLSSPVSQQTVDAAQQSSGTAGLAQVRRRSERAARQTSEIMRESDTAIREFQNTFQRLEEQGITTQASDPVSARPRIDSSDSGKGESPRNSLKTNSTQNDSSRNSRMQRPISLNVRANKSNNQRHRLLSEGSHPYEPAVPITRPQMTRERHYSGQQPINSQASTPIGAPQRMSGGFVPVMQPMYGSLQRNDDPRNMQIQQQHMMPYPPPPPPQSIRHSHHQGQPYEHHQPSKLQRQMSEPYNGMTHSSRIVPGHVPAPHFYSTFQEGPKPHQMPVRTSPKKPLQQEAKIPKNHYPSLPYKNSSSPYGENNSYPPGTEYDRPTTLQRHEKVPPMVKQISTSSGIRTGVFPDLQDEML